jgi:chromosomal replication initiation ATPase DnaA
MTLEEQVAHYKAVRERIATAHLVQEQREQQRREAAEREAERKETIRQAKLRRVDDAIRAALEQYADRKMLIVKECARKHGVEVADIFGHRKTAKILAARWEAIYRIKTTVKISHAALGKWMGGRDHTTIMYVMENYEKSLARGEAKVALEGRGQDRS